MGTASGMRSYATVCPAVCGEASSSSGGGRAFPESKRLPSATAHITPITCVKPAGRQRDSFFLLGAVLGSWVTRIPAVQNGLRLDDAQLGVALLSTSVGAILAMPATGWLVQEWGNPRVIRVAATALRVFAAATGPSMLLLMLALFIFGIGFGLLDVSMNVQAVVVEGLGVRSCRPSTASSASVVCWERPAPG